MMRIFETIAALKGTDRYVVLSEEGVRRIDDAARRILAVTGFKVGHTEVLDKLRAAGWRIDGNVVKVDGARLDRLLEKVPRQDDPRHVGEGTVRVGYLGNQIYDADLDQVRCPCRDDLDRATIVGLALPEVSKVDALVEPRDLPGYEDVVMDDVMLRRVKSPWTLEIINRRSAPVILDMAAVAAGSREEVLRRKLLIHHAFITSPLAYDRDTLDLALYMLSEGIPVRFGAPMNVAGATAPVTFAGTLAMVLAESYTGLILADLCGQTWGPSMASIVMDPRTGASQYSGPDRVLLSLATRDIHRYLGVGGGIGHNTLSDACKPGIQAGIEKAYTAMTSLLAGMPPSITHGGMLGPAGLVTSIEQIVIDAEVVSMLNRLVRGIEVNDETLALDLILEMGFESGYMQHEHTARHFRTELWLPTLITRLNPSAWNDEKPDMLAAARARVKDILASNDPRALDPSQERELDRIVARIRE